MKIKADPKAIHICYSYFASINKLAVLSNIESMNAEMIKIEIEKKERFQQLREIARYQLKIMNEKNSMKSIKKLSDDTYIKQDKRLEK